MKLNNQIFFSTILICFALVGKCVSAKPTLFGSLFSSSSSSPTPSSSSLSPSPTPSSSPTLFSSLSSPTPSPNEGRKTKTTTSYPPETSQFQDSPYMMSPSDAPSPSSDGGSSFSDFFKGTSKTKYNQGLVQICGHTHHPDVCLASISPLLKNKFDVIHVLQAAITVCTQHVKMTIAGIEKHAGASREISAALTDCKGHYTKALANLQKAMEAIHSRNFGSVTIMLSGVLADVSSAESKIEDLKSSNLKVESYSFVSIAASNCLSIASLIRN